MLKDDPVPNVVWRINWCLLIFFCINFLSPNKKHLYNVLNQHRNDTFHVYFHNCFFWEKLQETEKTCTQMFHFNKTNNQLNLVRQYLMTKLPYLIPCSWLITGFVTRLTRRVSLVEQELTTLPEHLSLPPVFSGVRVTRSLVCFVDRCLSFCTFSFGHCVVCLFVFDIRILITPLVSYSCYSCYSCQD